MSSRPECATPAALAWTFRLQPTGGPDGGERPVDLRAGPKIRRLLRCVGHMGHQFATRSGTRFFPHSAPPALSWAFVGQIGAVRTFGLVLVEECGVQWGVVE